MPALYVQYVLAVDAQAMSTFRESELIIPIVGTERICTVQLVLCTPKAEANRG